MVVSAHETVSNNNETTGLISAKFCPGGMEVHLTEKGDYPFVNLEQKIKDVYHFGRQSAPNLHIGGIRLCVTKYPDLTKFSVMRPPLCYAADYGQTQVLALLIAHGESINESDKYGITPLLAAIYEGHTACVKLLLEKGAKKDGKAPDGSSYIDCAEKQEMKDLLK